ncbi:hypothetical protein ScPMuIL_001173 [Solemya velum]
MATGSDLVASDKKIAEGLEHLRQAEKCMKTSLFKWKPDLDGAAFEYSKAATSFRNAKAFEQAKDASFKAADAHIQLNSPFHAAKSYEQAAIICKENKELEKAVELMEKAATMFQEHGTPDTAALTLDKAAKMVEMTHLDQAINLYIRACDVAELEADRERQCAEYIGKAARLMVRSKRYEEALATLKREIEFYAEVENLAKVNKLILGSLMIHLTEGDYVAADRYFQEALCVNGFCESEEAVACERLLKAYDEGDEEAARQVLSLPLVKYLDNCFARLARDMVIPGVLQ